jgi:lipoprotein-anchoring transpeptidase ErfK/SrfK
MKRPIPLLAVLLLAACSGLGATVPNPPPPQASASPSSVVLPPTVVPSAGPAPHDFSALDTGVKVPGSSILIFRRPRDNASSRNMVAHNPMGEKLVFLALDSIERAGSTWYQILMPRRPNGSTTWVKQDDGLKVVVLQERIEIDLSTYTLKRFIDGHLVGRFKVGVGMPYWPTPTGTFYVWAHVPQASPTGPYGAYALGLSGFSDVLTDWPGGGRFAIHGTPYRANTGRKVSHGCIRVFNPDVMTLKDVPLGTPVIITR